MKWWLCTTLVLMLMPGCTPLHTAKLEQNLITLTLRAPEAREVRLLASFDQFKPRFAVRDRQGNWRFTDLPNVDFSYFYLVDGKTVTPDCRFTTNDDFGTTNCRHIPRIQHASR